MRSLSRDWRLLPPSTFNFSSRPQIGESCRRSHSTGRRARDCICCAVGGYVRSQALAVGSLARIGMDDYMRNQFTWRVDMIVCFARPC